MCDQVLVIIEHSDVPAPSRPFVGAQIDSLCDAIEDQAGEIIDLKAKLKKAVEVSACWQKIAESLLGVQRPY